MVDIENNTNRMQAFNLNHQACHDAGFGRIARITQMEFDIGSATPKPTLVVRRIPGSITFLAKETMKGLPNAVLFAPEIVRALKADPPILTVRKQYSAETAPTDTTTFIDQGAAEPVGFDKGSGDSGPAAKGPAKKGH